MRHYRKKRGFSLVIFVLLIIIGAGAYFLFHAKGVKAEWFDQNWFYRQAVTVTVTSSSSDMANLDTWFTMNTSALISANKLQSNCQDLRFTSTNGNLLPYFIDSGCNTAVTKIWVRIDLVPKNSTIYTLYVYYGNPGAGPGSDSNKFNLYNGLVGYWNMNEPSWTNNCSTTSVKDFSVKGNNGTSCPNGTGPLGGATGKYGNAGSFDGSNDYVNAGSDPSIEINGSLTISAWIKPISAALDGSIINKIGTVYNYQLRLATGQPDFKVYDGTHYPDVVGNTEIDNNWHHIVGVRDTSTHTLIVYVDGVLDNTAPDTTTGSIVDPSTNAVIGQRGDLVDYFHGSIDEVRIYNRALSAAEVNKLYSDNTSSILTAIQGQSIPSVSFAAEEVGPAPVAYWKFDEGQGQTAYDSSSNKNNGTLGNSTGPDAYDPTWVANDQCISGKCLKFDGSASFVDPGTGSSLNITNAITVEAWVNPAQWGGVNNPIIYNRGVYSAIYKGIVVGLNDHNLVFEIGNGSTYTAITSSSSYSINKFQHVVFTWDGSTMKMYINGVQDATTGSITGSISYYVTTARIGAEHWGYNARVFNGFIDDVKIYPYARTAAQIQADYNSRGSSFGTSTQVGNQSSWMTNGLVGYWKMDETSGTSVVDSSGSNNTGTLTNAQESRAAMTGSTLTTISDTGNANLSGTNNVYNGMFLSMSGASCNVIGQQRPISGYTASTKTITVSSAFSAIPSITNCTYTILHQARGEFGNGLQFDGINDYVQVAHNSVLEPSSVTVAAWVNLTSKASRHLIITKWIGYTLEVDLNGYPYFNIKTDTSQEGNSSPVAIPWGTWVYLVGTFDSSTKTIKTYINGVEKVSTIATTGINYGGNALRFSDCTYSCASGNIDEVRIYNRALSSKEVSDLYNWAPGPVGWWKFDDNISGDSQTIIDSSGYGNNGAINGNANCKVLGKYATGCQFFSETDSVGVPTVPSLQIATHDLSISAWIKFTSITDINTIEWKGGGADNSAGYWLWYYGTDGTLRFYLGNGSSRVYAASNSNLGLDDGKWHFIAVSAVRSGSATFYKDGVNIGNFDISSFNGQDLSTTWDVEIGGNISDIFSGILDNVMIYNYARTQKQVLQDMNAGHPSVGSPVGSYAAYWKFDEGYGNTIHDVSVNANTGTIHGASWTNDGKFGKALSFGGNSSYVDVGNNASLLNITNAITIEAWIKPMAFNTSMDIVNNDYQSSVTGYEFGVDSSSKLMFRINIAANPYFAYRLSTSSVKAGVWQHVTAVYDGTNIYFYINGVADPPVAANGSLHTSAAGPVYIGDYRTPGTFSFNGVIDEVKIYPSALTADDIKTEYNRGSALKMGSVSDTSGLTGGSTASNSASAVYCIPGDTASCKGPVGEWKFDENVSGNNQTLYDTSGNGNNAITSGNVRCNVIGAHATGCQFDGTDNASVANNSVLDGAKTFEFWAKIPIADGQDGILSKMNGATVGYAIFVNNASNSYSLRAAFNTTLVTFVPLINQYLNKWTHYAITITGAGCVLYINGVAVDTQPSFTGTPSSSTAPLYLGQEYWWTGAYFQGPLDEIRIFNYARTPAQIAWDYNKGKPVGWWKFDECQGTTANDASGNGNNGTITIGGTGTQTTAGTCLTPTNGTGAWYNGKVGKFNSSMSFDGNDDYVSISGTNLEPPQSKTAEAWIYYPSTPTSQGILGTDNGLANGSRKGWGIIIDTAIEFEIVDGSKNACDFQLTIPPAGRWHHLALVQDYGNNILYAYLDGTRVGQQSCTGFTPNGSNFTIGEMFGSWYFKGLIDDVKVYNYALTPQQILMDYNQGAAVRFGPVTGKP